MERSDPRSRRDEYGLRINRAHSPVLAYAVPYIMIVIGSLLPLMFIASAVPLVPPLSFAILLSWRLIRPGLIPPWAGFPLGLIDDLFSGQPFGSAILLFSAALLILEAIEARLPWRNFIQDWFTAGAAIGCYLLCAMLISGAPITVHSLFALGPQLLLTFLLFPMISRLVARLDRLRLLRFRTVG